MYCLPFLDFLTEILEPLDASYPLVAEMMMMRRMTATTTPMISIIFIFCHQYFLFSLVA